MINIYSFLVFLLSSASMLSGLIVAPLGTCLLASLLIANYKKIDFTRLKKNKVELIFLGWLFISCIWSISGLPAFTKFFSILLFFCSTILVTDNNLYDNIDKFKKFALPLFFGCLLAIIFFIIEDTTQGFITMKFRSAFQPSYRHLFAMYFLDRGCAVLSMLSWPLIYVLLKKRKIFLAIVYILIVGYILRISDSLASYLAFVFGTCTFLALYLSRLYVIYLIMIGVLSSAIAIPIFSTYQMPRELSLKYPSQIPDSGKHRLFIWKFTAGKAIEKPFFGWGFDASSNIPVDEENDLIYINQYRWHPLPLHPHNNFMQIWLECGVIGLSLFVSILLRVLQRILIISRKNSDNLWGALAGSCFVNYWFIAMISFGMWQMWWVATIGVTILFFNIFAKMPSPELEL